VVLLTVDALRADHLSGYGYPRDTSPAIDRLGSSNVRFVNAYSASSHTRESVPAILTGRYPDQAVDADYRLATESVAARLSRAGIGTAAFHSNPFVSRAYGFDAGFDAFDDDLRLGQNRYVALFQRLLDKFRNRHYARAERINKRALEWIDSHADDRFFLWNHYMDVHGPYVPPGEHGVRYVDSEMSARDAQRLYKRAIGDPESITDEERAALRNRYDGEIRYTDAQIDRFLEALEERGLLSESLIVVTSDHGEAFGEHGYYEHPRYLHDELIRVPMLLAGGEASSGTVESPVSTLDVVPTILETFGLDTDGLPGVPLQGVAADPESFADRVVYAQARGEGGNESRRRFVARAVDRRCFLERDAESGDVVTESARSEDSDPTGAGDTSEESDLTRSLRRHSTRRLSAVDDRSYEQGAEKEVGAAVEDRLEALGYKER
jgi:arylsulfatase